MSDYKIKEKAGKASPFKSCEMERMETPAVYQMRGHHEFLALSINICDEKTLPFSGRRHGQED